MMEKNYTIERDPVRKLVLNRIKELGLTEIGVSAAIGRNRAYINQYLYRGIPEVLPEDTRHELAKAIKLDERQLRSGKVYAESSVNTDVFTPIDNSRLLFAELTSAAIRAAKGHATPASTVKETTEKISAYFWPDVEKGKPPTYDQVLRMAQTLIGTKK